MDSPNIITDPAALVRELRTDPIRERLDAIAREREALLVLLRAAQAAERRDRKAVADGR